ncbi:MAG TPA: 2-oxoglutarate dehydrogenase complex dihydrolipoyllysine-residue succinyltransferase [Candidatus Saccharimonadaceae bacterium]|nr:2-oxoglutarate dehydrogenase complex dihydrolipoyllysine-residue succinyltransferase [Candidatus Saccharimonadaceae bacterium]
MSAELQVPRLAESISEAVLVEWLKPDGAAVRVDEPVATLETDKAAVEIAAADAGLLRHVSKVGDRVVVGQVIARIEAGAGADGGARAAQSAPALSGAARGGAATEAKPQGTKTQAPPAAAPAPNRSAAPIAVPATPGPATAAAPASSGATASAAFAPGDAPLAPSVRRLVEEHALDPASIAATGKGGRLLKEDVLRHLEAPPAPAPAPAPAERSAAPAPAPRAASPAAGAPEFAEGEEERAVPMSRIRQRIAERLVQAQRTAAILTTFNEIDMTATLALRARYKDAFEKRHGVKLGFMSLFGRAAILALGEIPELNAEIRGTDIVYRRHVNLGVAVGTPRGLVVPVVRRADALDFAGIEREIARLATRARDGSLSLDELSGGTFTISNGGVYGSLLSTPILNPPQSGILGMHKIEKRPIAVDDQVVIRPMMYVALSYDHRIVDGEQAVTFLVRVKERLEDPERMLLDV